MTELSPRIAAKAAYLYAFKGMKAVWAYKQRLKKGELYPPFMFVALTNTCNLRCQGCWVEKEGTGHFLPTEDLSKMIAEGKKRNAHYYTLLGGEPSCTRASGTSSVRTPTATSRSSPTACSSRRGTLNA
jgi:hypothetical protein